MVSKLQRLYYDKNRLNDLSAALLQYPDKEFRSPTRSTVPFLALLKDGYEILTSLLIESHMNTNSHLHLEFTVKPQKGRGKASHTDLMVRWQVETLALEAKWTEPRYETVAEWSRQGKSPMNRERVLSGWLDLIQPHAARALKVNDFSDAVYQMVHRAASACYNSGKPRLAYLHFAPDPSGQGATSEQYQSDLEHLHDLLGNPTGFSFYLIEVKIRPTAAFERIMSLPKGSAATANKVSAALDNGPLFDFTDFRLQAIKEASLK